MISKTRLTVIICLLSIITLSSQKFLSNSNYNSEETEIKHLVEIEEDNHHSKILFIKGFMRGLQIFNNITHVQECFSNCKDISKDIREIMISLHNVTTYDELINVVRHIADVIEQIGIKLDKVEPECKKMNQEIWNVLEKVKKHCDKDHQIKNFIAHTVANIGPIMGRIQCIKRFIRDGNCYHSGYETGELMNFLFLWDYNRTNTTQYDSLAEDWKSSDFDKTFDFNIAPFIFE